MAADVADNSSSFVFHNLVGYQSAVKSEENSSQISEFRFHQIESIWRNEANDGLATVISGILQRKNKIDERLKQFTSADILAGISFKNSLTDPKKRRYIGDDTERFPEAGLICHTEQSRNEADGKNIENSSRKQRLSAGENPWVTPGLHYSNPFDPRLTFNGLLSEHRLNGPVEAADQHQQSADNINCLLAFNNPIEFVNEYLSKYRQSVVDLCAKVPVPEITAGERQTEQRPIDEEITPVFDANCKAELTMWQKIQAVRHFWRNNISLPENINETQGFGKPIEILNTANFQQTRFGRGRSYKKSRVRRRQYLRDTCDMSSDGTEENSRRSSGRSRKDIYDWLSGIQNGGENNETLDQNKLEGFIPSIQNSVASVSEVPDQIKGTTFSSDFADQLENSYAESTTPRQDISSYEAIKGTSFPQNDIIPSGTQAFASQNISFQRQNMKNAVNDQEKGQSSHHGSAHNNRYSLQADPTLPTFPPQTSMFWSHQQRQQKQTASQAPPGPMLNGTFAQQDFRQRQNRTGNVSETVEKQKTDELSTDYHIQPRQIPSQSFQSGKFQPPPPQQQLRHPELQSQQQDQPRQCNHQIWQQHEHTPQQQHAAPMLQHQTVHHKHHYYRQQQQQQQQQQFQTPDTNMQVQHLQHHNYQQQEPQKQQGKQDQPQLHLQQQFVYPCQQNVESHASQFNEQPPTNKYMCPPPAFTVPKIPTTGDMIGTGQSQNLKFDDEVWYIDGIPYQHARPLTQPSVSFPVQNPSVPYVPRPSLQQIPWRPVINSDQLGPVHPVTCYQGYQSVPLQHLPYKATMRPKNSAGYHLGIPLQVNDMNNNNNVSEDKPTDDQDDGIEETPIITLAQRPSSSLSDNYATSNKQETEENENPCVDYSQDHPDNAITTERSLSEEKGGVLLNDEFVNKYVESLVEHELERSDHVRKRRPAKTLRQNKRSDNKDRAISLKVRQFKVLKSDVKVDPNSLSGTGRKIRVIRPSRGGRDKIQKFKPQRSITSSLIKIL